MMDLCFETLVEEPLANAGLLRTSVSESPPARAVNPPIFKKPLREMPSQYREEEESKSVSMLVSDCTGRIRCVRRRWTCQPVDILIISYVESKTMQTWLVLHTSMHYIQELFSQ